MVKRRLSIDRISVPITKFFGKACKSCGDIASKEYVKELCKRCSNKKVHERHNPRRARIDGNTFYFQYEPRSGICDNCGRSKDNPADGITRTCLCLEGEKIEPSESQESILKRAKELCIRCHCKVHAKAKDALRKRGFAIA